MSLINIVVGGHTLRNFTQEEAEEEVKLLFQAYKTTGMTISLVSSYRPLPLESSNVLAIYYMDKELAISKILIN